ncbi:MAG: ATP-binding protein, partial [Cyanobacteria bacterium J06597_16]
IKPTDLNQSLDSTLLILNTEISKGIDIVKKYDTLPLVRCQPSDLNQVFMNILLNAIAALEECATKQITIQTLALENEQVQITIRDSGPGIPTEIQGKVFDPFFTTKPVGKGTGLGLALSYQTIQQHHGQLRLHSTPHQGTTLLIQLPVH